MGDYNLAGLNPREFEHLVQSLAVCVLGSGVTPFGDGPDGGREATFSGKMPYPSHEENWNGYLIIQAKYCIRPTKDNSKDGEWALGQLKNEMEKFNDRKRNLPKPDYYIFVTNVVLTPAQSTGSKDKLAALMNTYQSLLGIKGWDVWDFDKLCRFLDVYESIRHCYTAFITAGDVFAEMMNLIKDQHPSFWPVISKFIQREFYADQFVKLEQAGHLAEQKTSLSQVFVDLPVIDRPPAEFVRNEKELEEQSRTIVAEILDAGAQILKRSSFTNQRTIMEASDNGRPEPGRFVLVGGPGQGKSTVGQFVCQLYRAAILDSQSKDQMMPEVRDALRNFTAQCEKDNILLPMARRFPIRIILENFSNELASGKVKSLRSYILNRINYRTDEECSSEDIKRWLSDYPWLIVLDGLDEVPATSNRKQVLEKIFDFWSDVATLDADVLVLATTRPQGYSNEFAPRYYSHRYLVPLSPTYALHYAKRLIEARFGNDVDRSDRILRRLQTACEQKTTNRLMSSPLQVTIMATLVDQIGQPPQERWRLFQQYYEVIYLRETEREIRASRILQQRKTDINVIHQRVGLFLQAESEKAGSTESKLPIEKFRVMVRSRIAEEGYKSTQLDSITSEIAGVALNRLVFLVGLEEDRIGFEIRSLQEFMAAEALMNGGDEQVRLRLFAIAPIAHWRNVFLFAAGKIFSERQFLRDMIVTICDELNDKQNVLLSGTLLVGSRLALDILDDGIVREQPTYARRLLRIAIRLGEFSDIETNMRLVSLFEKDYEPIYREYLEQQFLEKDIKRKIGAWQILLAMIEPKISWAKEMAEANWPKNLLNS